MVYIIILVLPHFVLSVPHELEVVGEVLHGEVVEELLGALAIGVEESTDELHSRLDSVDGEVVSIVVGLQGQIEHAFGSDCEVSETTLTVLVLEDVPETASSLWNNRYPGNKIPLILL
jgi:hypothetical protein